MYRHRFKRIGDILVGTLAFIGFSPLMLIVALAIKVFDPGPILFRQLRVGRGGEQFSFYKFRSMPVNTGDIASDQLGSVRLTWIGRFIRRTSLDELPQLFNIIYGDMSLVGPRPPIAGQTELIRLRRENGALDCRPGLTGWAQINSYDGMSVAEKARLDGEYASRLTLLRDLHIVLRTFGYLLKPPPKY